MLLANRRVSMNVQLERVNHYHIYLRSQRECKICKKNNRKEYKNVTVGSTAITLKSDMALIKALLAFLSLAN